MKLLRDLLDQAEAPFRKGGRLERLYPLSEVVDSEELPAYETEEESEKR